MPVLPARLLYTGLTVYTMHPHIPRTSVAHASAPPRGLSRRPRIRYPPRTGLLRFNLHLESASSLSLMHAYLCVLASISAIVAPIVTALLAPTVLVASSNLLLRMPSQRRKDPQAPSRREPALNSRVLVARMLLKRRALSPTHFSRPRPLLPLSKTHPYLSPATGPEDATPLGQREKRIALCRNPIVSPSNVATDDPCFLARGKRLSQRGPSVGSSNFLGPGRPRPRAL